MLKYSFMTFACPEYSLEEVIGAAVRHGYDGVEPRVVSDHRHGVELERTKAEREAIRRRFEDAEVAVACIATSVRLNRPEARERQDMVEQTKAYIALAADVGAKRVRVFGGHAEDKPDHETALARVVEGLRACAETAAAHEVFVCLETHDYFCPGKDVAAIVNEVNAPWIRATWDVQHPVTAGEDVALTESVLMPLTEHVHFHDTDRRDGKADCVPIGEGEAPVEAFLSIFGRHGFEGYISGEWFYNHGPEKDLADFIGALKKIEGIG